MASDFNFYIYVVEVLSVELLLVAALFFLVVALHRLKKVIGEAERKMKEEQKV